LSIVYRFYAFCVYKSLSFIIILYVLLFAKWRIV
jgi:hypothetical protein